MEPIEFLQFANQCLESELESSWRSACSRAYYAGYHAVSPLVDGLASKSGDAGEHEKLLSKLANSKNTTHKWIGRILDQCKKRRVKADYIIGYSFRKKMAEVQCYEIDRIFKRIEALSTKNANVK